MKLKKTLLVVLVFFYLSSVYFLIKDFNKLPSPIYGGDTYHQLGQIQHIIDGGGLFSGYNILNSLPAYLPLFAIYVAFFAKITGLKAINALLYSSLISSILSIITLYYLLRKLFNKELLIAILILLYFPLTRLLIVKYSVFTQLILMPFFYLLLYDFFLKKEKKYLLAVIYGLLGISHPVSFIIASLLIVIFTIYFKYYTYKKIKQVIIVFLIGFFIAQIYWFKPLFIYKLQAKNNYLDWNNEDFGNTSLQLNYFAGIIKENFFNLSLNIFHLLSSLSALIGLALIFLLKKNSYKLNFLYIFNLSSFLILFHYFITRPLIGIDLYPLRINDMLFFYNTVFLSGLCLEYLSNKIKKYKKPVLIGIICLLIILSFNTFIKQKNSNKWYTSARIKLPDKFLALQEFVIKNTEVNDVFISTNELSFALNALTGRKVLNTRRAQNDPYIDMDERILAAATILYGNNTKLRDKLIKKYNIKYLFWDEDWIFTEYRIENKNVVPFDPLNLFDSVKKREILNNLNISYQLQHTWVDPAIRGKGVKKFDMILITPKYKSPEQPWVNDLNNKLEEIFNFENKTKIYKIK